MAISEARAEAEREVRRLQARVEELEQAIEQHKKVIGQYRRGLDGDARELKRLRDELDDAARKEPKNLAEAVAAVSFARNKALDRAADLARDMAGADPVGLSIAAAIRALKEPVDSGGKAALSPPEDRRGR